VGAVVDMVSPRESNLKLGENSNQKSKCDVIKPCVLFSEMLQTSTCSVASIVLNDVVRGRKQAALTCTVSKTFQACRLPLSSTWIIKNDHSTIRLNLAITS